VERYVKQNAENWTKVGARVVSVESTNDSLREQVQAFAKTGHVLPEGYSLRADYQTAGKGRLGRKWGANPNENLLISFLLKSPGLLPGQLFLLLQNIALAVRATVEPFAVQKSVKVKWPNDILIGEEKVAGILIESILAGAEVSCIIVGIGINVKQVQFDPAFKATSLALSFGREVSIDEVAVSLTRHLQSAHAYLRELVNTADVYTLQQRYHAHLFGFGQRLVFQDLKSQREIIGKVIGVLPSGKLRLEQDGEEYQYSLDEIKFLRKNGI